MKRFSVTQFFADAIVSFDCDELPADVHDAPRVSIRLNVPISREAIERELASEDDKK